MHKLRAAFSATLMQRAGDTKYLQNLKNLTSVNEHAFPSFSEILDYEISVSIVIWKCDFHSYFVTSSFSKTVHFMLSLQCQSELWTSKFQVICFVVYKVITMRSHPLQKPFNRTFRASRSLLIVVLLMPLILSCTTWTLEWVKYTEIIFVHADVTQMPDVNSFSSSSHLLQSFY